MTHPNDELCQRVCALYRSGVKVRDISPLVSDGQYGFNLYALLEYHNEPRREPWRAPQGASREWRDSMFKMHARQIHRP